MISDTRKGTIALKLGTANTEDTPRRFRCSHMRHPIYKALAELGRASKTIFLCRYLHSLEVGREIHEGSMGTDGCYAALKSWANFVAHVVRDLNANVRDFSTITLQKNTEK